MHPNKAALVFALLLGGWHLLWALLVAAGWAQPLIDFIFRIHFIRPVYVIENFNIGTAFLLIAITAAIGYAIGFSLAISWNKLHGPARVPFA
jgi:hypothetical protein